MSVHLPAGSGCDCYHHPDVKAEGMCTVCGKCVCGSCSALVEGVLVCIEPDHQAVLRDWGKIHESVSEYEGDLVAKNLELQGITTKAFSSRAYALTIAETDEKVARVFVRKDDIDFARAILQRLGLNSGQ